MTREEALEYRRKIEAAAGAQTDEAALESIDLFPKWRPDIDVTAGQRLQHDGLLYRVVQPHRTQEDWTPDVTPALFVRVSLEEWPEWVQPTGAHDAYAKGAKVAHNGRRWTSDVDGNVWEPGVYGWTINE